MSTVIAEELEHFPPPGAGDTPDLFDPTVRSKRTREEVGARASPVSRRWQVVSEVQVEAFRQALWGACGPG